MCFPVNFTEFLQNISGRLFLDKRILSSYLWRQNIPPSTESSKSGDLLIYYTLDNSKFFKMSKVQNFKSGMYVFVSHTN